MNEKEWFVRKAGDVWFISSRLGRKGHMRWSQKGADALAKRLNKKAAV